MAAASAIVIAQRLVRTHDSVEMMRMIVEKQTAAVQCALSAQQALLRACLTPLSFAANWVALSEAMLGPYHRGARANARRLRRRP
jgi:hypothetical protein